MERRIHIRLVGISLTFALLGTQLYCTLFRIQPASIRRRINEGQPTVFAQDEDYFWLAISDVVVAGEYVYAVYSHQSFAKAYDKNGNYVCTIALPDVLWRGEAIQAYAKEKSLYLKGARSGNVYEFDRNVFRKCYAFRENPDMAEKIRANKEQYRNTDDLDGWTYFTDGFGIHRKKSGGEQEIFINRSFLKYICTHFGVWSIWILPIVVFVSYDQYCRKAHKGRNVKPAAS